MPTFQLLVRTGEQATGGDPIKDAVFSAPIGIIEAQDAVEATRIAFEGGPGSTAEAADGFREMLEEIGEPAEVVAALDVEVGEVSLVHIHPDGSVHLAPAHSEGAVA